MNPNKVNTLIREWKNLHNNNNITNSNINNRVIINSNINNRVIICWLIRRQSTYNYLM